MEFGWTEEQKAVRDKVRSFLEANLPPDWEATASQSPGSEASAWEQFIIGEQKPCFGDALFSRDWETMVTLVYPDLELREPDAFFALSSLIGFPMQADTLRGTMTEDL
jgi:hypothetical protein